MRGTSKCPGLGFPRGKLGRRQISWLRHASSRRATRGTPLPATTEDGRHRIVEQLIGSLGVAAENWHGAVYSAPFSSQLGKLIWTLSGPVSFFPSFKSFLQSTTARARRALVGGLFSVALPAGSSAQTTTTTTLAVTWGGRRGDRRDLHDKFNFGRCALHDGKLRGR